MLSPRRAPLKRSAPSGALLVHQHTRSSPAKRVRSSAIWCRRHCAHGCRSGELRRSFKADIRPTDDTDDSVNLLKDVWSFENNINPASQLAIANLSRPPQSIALSEPQSARSMRATSSAHCESMRAVRVEFENLWMQQVHESSARVKHAVLVPDRAVIKFLTARASELVTQVWHYRTKEFCATVPVKTFTIVPATRCIGPACRSPWSN